MKEAAGQYILYEGALAESPENADRVLFLAVRDETYAAVFEEPIGQMLLRHSHIRLVIFDPIKEEIIQWKK